MGKLIINELLRYNFYLSKWFAGKKHDKIIPGTSFLFLNQISFIFLSVYLFLVKFLPFKLHTYIFVGLIMLGTSFIMFGLQKRMELRVRENNYDKEFKKLTNQEIYKNRSIGLLIFIASFSVIFIVAIFIY